MRRIVIVATAILLTGCVSVTSPATTVAAPYRASGNEPFWSVTIADGRAVLEQLDQVPRSFALGAVEAVAEDRRYAGKGIIIDVATSRCIDSMSGVARTEQVTVQMGNERLSGCGGERLPPETLQGTQWAVVSLDGVAVTLDPPPSLAIDAEGRVSGSDGCNRFIGGLTLGAPGAATASGPAAGTMMACAPGRDQVSRSYNALRAAVTGWRFDGDRLVLSTDDGKVILLRQSL